MVSTFLSAALLCGLTALACPTDKDQSGVAVQSVAMTEKSDCPLGCKGEQAAVQNASLKTEKSGCCAEKNAAGVRNASLTTEKTGCCAEKGAAVQSVALATGGEKGECAKACDGQSGFAVPAMAYRVGDETVNCPVSAKAMAEKSKASVQYVVSGVAYETEARAQAAHADEMERFADSLTRVTLVVNGQKVECAEKIAECAKACESTKVQYQVGPAVFDSAEEAVRVAAAAYSAVQAVSLTYAVNGEKTQCSVEAQAKSKACGSPIEYVVNGQQTPCGDAARYMMSRERMAAAVAAVQKSIG